MEKLVQLFGRSIRFPYHCFDRIVIRGYLSTLSRLSNSLEDLPGDSCLIVRTLLNTEPLNTQNAC